MDDFENSCEPMDVDLSVHSANAMDISYTDCLPESLQTSVKQENSYRDDNDTSSRKDSPIKVVNVVKHSDNIAISSNYRNIIFISILVCGLSFLTYDMLAIKCYEDLNLESFKNALHNNLYGQERATGRVIEFLELKNKSKILILYGGTGVGKTLTVSLLLKNISNYTNIYHYTMSSLRKTFSSELMIGLTLCKSSIIVIDDINIKDKEIIKYINDINTKSVSLDKNVTIILIYNCVDTDRPFMTHCSDGFLTELQLSFNDVNAAKSFVKYETLTEDSLLKCIQHELGNRHLKDSSLSKIIKNFNVKIDGCKGVHQKMKYLNVL